MIITWSATIAGVVLVAVELGGWPYDQVSCHPMMTITMMMVMILMMMMIVIIYCLVP